MLAAPEDGGVRLAAGSRECPELELTPEPEPPHIELMLAMPRPKVMMRLYSSLAQIGLRRIVLTNAVRVEKPYFSSHAVERAKYLPELQDGLEQAVSTRLPEVRVEQRLKPFVEDSLDGLFPDGLLRLLCHPGEGSKSVSEAVRRAPTPPRGVVLAVGPEGGWVDFELEMLERKGFQRVSLGTRIFSTDVAVLALTTLAADALAEIGAVPLPHEGPPGRPGLRFGSASRLPGTSAPSVSFSSGSRPCPSLRATSASSAALSAPHVPTCAFHGAGIRS